MKRNTLTFTIGILIVLIFGALLFTFQVRQTEVALVTTFGKPTRDINTDPNKPEPGLYFKAPWPIQKVQKFDKRVQNFEDKFSETQTRDGKNVLVAVYAGWTISDPKVFRERFAGSVQRAEQVLEGLINDSKNTVIGQHPFSNFISTNPEELKFAQIESTFRVFHADTVTRRAVLCVKPAAALYLLRGHRGGVRCIGTVRKAAGRDECQRNDELLHLDYESVA